MKLDAYFKKQTLKIDKALAVFLPKAKEHPVRLHEAMRYAVLCGGKRIRPILVLAACEAAGGDEKKAMPAACAIEFIHNYSLVHDDMPCMDNDDERRGAPTCHKKYGEDTALLVGDALLTLAFQVLSRPNGFENPKDLKRKLQAFSLISEASGTAGMVGGQAVDIEFQNKEVDMATLEYINTHKSGALIAVSTRVGALLGGGTALEIESLYRYGKYLGLLFQIVDDILDREGYAKVLGAAEAKREAGLLLLKAKKALSVFGRRALILEKIADFVMTRNR